MSSKSLKANRFEARYIRTTSGVRRFVSSFNARGKPVFGFMPVFTLKLDPACGKALWKAARA